MGAQRQHGRIAWVTALVFAGVMLSACGTINRIARVNHLHSEANQKQTEKALEAFQQTTSDRIGLSPTLLKNLEALTALRRTVADTRSKLDDRDRGIALADFTWLSLRQDLLNNLGLLEAPPTLVSSVQEALDNQRKRVLAGGQRLSDRIRFRLERIEAVVTVLEALIAGDRALVVQARKDVELSAKKKEAPKKEEPKKDGTKNE